MVIFVMLASGYIASVCRPGTDDATVRTLPEAPSGATLERNQGCHWGFQISPAKAIGNLMIFRF